MSSKNNNNLFLTEDEYFARVSEEHGIPVADIQNFTDCSRKTLCKILSEDLNKPEYEKYQIQTGLFTFGGSKKVGEKVVDPSTGKSVDLPDHWTYAVTPRIEIVQSLQSNVDWSEVPEHLNKVLQSNGIAPAPEKAAKAA